MEISPPALTLPVFPSWQELSQKLKTIFAAPTTWEMIAFAVRNWIASMLAFYLACAAQFDSPHWAWLTVWIVAQPTPGMVLSKSLYRVFGTVLGSALGVILIALFAQTPEFFVAALALVVGFCTLISHLLTNFRAYATVLTAYTAGIIAADAINSPDRVFDIGVARASCILIGITSSILVTSLFAPHHAHRETLARIKNVLQNAARRAAYSWHDENATRLRIGRQLIFDCINLNTQIEYAAAESGEFRIQAPAAKSLLAHVFSTISARRALDAHLLRRGWPPHHLLSIFHEVILDFLHELPNKLAAEEVSELLQQIASMRTELENLHPEHDTLQAEDLISERVVIDRLDDLLFSLQEALEDWSDILHQRRTDKPLLVLNFHRDFRAACINGLRAVVAVCVTGAFWIATAWPSGPNALIFVSILLSLFSLQPQPDRVGWRFFYAGLGASFLAILCKYFVLTSVANYETLTLALGLFLLPLGLFMAHPPTSAFSTSFSLVFLNLVQPANPMTFNLADTLNSAVAILVGILFGTLAFTLILPPDPRLARAYVTYRIRLGLERLALFTPQPSRDGWETRMYDRVLRLNDPANLSGTPTDEWLEAGLGALNLGNEILRIRTWLSMTVLADEIRQTVQPVLARLGKIMEDPQEVEETLRRQRQILHGLDPGANSTQRKTWARLQGALEEIQHHLADHPLLLHKEAA